MSVAVAGLSGCGGGGGGGAAATPAAATNRAPIISAFSVLPTSLAFSGGEVTYTVSASDADGDNITVTVVVTRPDGSTQTLPQVTGVSGTFEIKFTSPGNVSSSGAATYIAAVSVTDGKDTATKAGANYAVSALPSGPPPPPPPVLP